MVKTVNMSLKTALGLNKGKPSLEKFLCIMHEQGFICSAITVLPMTSKSPPVLLIVLTRIDSELIFGDIDFGPDEGGKESSERSEDLGKPEVL